MHSRRGHLPVTRAMCQRPALIGLACVQAHPAGQSAKDKQTLTVSVCLFCLHFVCRLPRVSLHSCQAIAVAGATPLPGHDQAVRTPKFGTSLAQMHPLQLHVSAVIAAAPRVSSVKQDGVQQGAGNADGDSQVAELERKLGDDVLTSLEMSISSDEFRNRLQRSRQFAASTTRTDTAELDAILGDYVVVTKQDAIDAMAAYLAAWLSNIPEAKGMEPLKLQEALLTTIQVSPAPVLPTSVRSQLV
jgi:hypothetical protein